jgi:hypothetical protein
MEQLKKDYLKQYYYVNNGVIFNIKKYDDGDDCAIYSEDIKDNIPYITVKKQVQEGETSEPYKLYLDIYIADGDDYAENTFKKKIHPTEGTTSKVTFQEYYKTLCENEVYLNVLRYFEKDFTWFSKNLNVLGIPMYMISGQGYQVTGIKQIQFDASYLSTLKDTIAKEETKKAAEKTAKSLGYKLTSEITVQKEE